ncbi:MAG: CARDB domain-containing protein [Peptococcaceae bacterium]|jgi:hypothetical protein|nr:hypothetical protein [Peptococcaceae bacterium]MDH7523919.1 CARDB domain-containing protein [Peptococcaceae bacterium]
MKKLLVFVLIMLLMFATFTIFLIPALSVALPERLENQALSARLTWTPQELVPGNNATFTLSIKSTAASTVSNVKVRISGNYYPFTPEELGKQPALADTFDLLLPQLTDAERNKLTAFNIEKILPILAANSQESISHTYKLPSTNLLPTLVVRVKIEGLPDKEEKRYIIPVQAPGVNAKISSFTSSKTTGLTKGQTLTFSATVKNLSKSLFPGVLGLYAGDALLLEKPLLLSGNQSSVIGASWTVPGPGAYNIKAVFNKAFLPEFLHSLADSPSSLTLTVPDLKPDLTITKIETVPAGVVPGSTANIQVTVQNKGGTSCPAGSKLTLTAGGQSSEANLPALNKNASKTVNFNKFLFPSTENFVISAKVNPPPGTVESDEKNNFLEYTPNLLFPDLAITKLTMTPSSAAPGAPVKITASVKNTGAGQCPAGGVC